MIPFKTTAEQVLKLAAAVVEMEKAGLAPDFIVEIHDLARVDQGVYDLVALWRDAQSVEERDEIVADLQESLDDYGDAPREPLRKPYIRYDQLDDVAARVRVEKDRLRRIIDQHGGVSAVAQKSGIPQPSLSRMLNSPSIPRRTTLFKIANALDLPETEIAFEWTR